MNNMNNNFNLLCDSYKPPSYHTNVNNRFNSNHDNTFKKSHSVNSYFNNSKKITIKSINSSLKYNINNIIKNKNIILNNLESFKHLENLYWSDFI